MTKLYDPRDSTQRWDQPETWKECGEEPHPALVLIHEAIKFRASLSLPFDDQFFTAALELIRVCDEKAEVEVEIKDVTATAKHPGG